MIPVLRRFLPALAIVLASVLVLSDWPLDWSFWLDHPLLTAFVAGLVLLLLTGSVVDVILRRREARRWVDLGRGAAYALDQVFYFSGIAMFQLLDVGGHMRLSPEIEFHVAPARARAAQLLPNPPDPGGVDVMIEVNEEARRRCKPTGFPFFSGTVNGVTTLSWQFSRSPTRRKRRSRDGSARSVLSATTRDSGASVGASRSSTGPRWSCNTSS